MKKRSTTARLPQQLLFACLVLVMTALLPAGKSWGQTTIFRDNFDRTTPAAVSGTSFTGVPAGGTPSATYTTATGSTIVTVGGSQGASSRTNQTSGTDYSLQLVPADASSQTGSSFVYTSAPHVTSSNPLLTTTLSSNTFEVIWNFNMRTNRTSYPLSGYGSGSYGGGFVLGATSANLNTANGYAVTIEKGAISKTASFTSGLVSSSVTAPISTADLQPGYLIFQSTGIPAGTTIATVPSATSFTVSKASVSTSAARTLTIYPTYVTGATTVGSTSVVLASKTTSNSSNYDSVRVGQYILGSGIPSGAYITAIAENTPSAGLRTLTISAAPANFSLSQYTYSSGSNVINTTSSTSTLYVGQVITGTDIPAGSTIASIASNSSFTISNNVTASSISATGTGPTSSTAVTLGAGNVSIVAGMVVTGTGINTGTTVAAISGTSLTLSQNSNSTTAVSGTLYFTKSTTSTGTGSSGSTAVTLAASNPTILVGMNVTGTGITTGTTVATISGTSLTLSQNSSGAVSGTLTFNNTTLTVSSTISANALAIGGGNNIKLLRFAGGLIAGTRTELVNSGKEFFLEQVNSNKTNWASIQVVYTPATNTWKMYLRDEGSSASPSSDFSTNMVLVGTKIDATYTGSVLSHFGPIWNYSASATNTSNTLLVDNFAVSVNNPTINAPSVNTLSGFAATNSFASAEKSFTISGQYLTNSIIATAPADYEVSTTSGGSFGATATIANSATVAATTIYVRLKSGLSDGAKTGNIIIASTGATTTSSYTVALSGSVSSTPALLPSASSLSAFANTAAGASSTSQNFTLSGVNLNSGNVTVTAPANFTVSTNDADYGNSVTITPSTGNVSATIYVKYSPTGNGGYNGNVVINSPDIVTDQNISVSGYLSKFYYKSGSTSLKTTSNWSGKFDGSGTSVPNDFTTPGISYVILNSTTTTDSTWNVAGTDSKIVIGDPAVPGVTLTLASGFDITTTAVAPIVGNGVVDLPAASSGSNKIFLENAGAPPAFGTMDPMSEVHYKAVISTSSTKTFGKVFVENNAALTYTGTPIISTSLTVDAGSSLSLSSSGSYVYINSGGTSTINGSLIIARLPGAFSWGVATAGTGFGAIQFKDAYNAISPNFALGSNSTVTYSRTSSASTSTQTISLLPSGISYANLTVSDGTGSGFLVARTFAAGAYTVSGAFTVNHINPATSTISLSGATLTVNGSVVLTSGALAGSGNLTLGNGATISRAAGSLDAAPAAFGSTTNVIYNGTAAIVPSFEMPASGLNNLTISNAAGVTLNANKTVNGTLTLSSGVLSTTSSYTLTAVGSVSRTSGWVYGNLKKAISATGTYLFEVGDATINYAPASIDVSSVSAAGNLVVTSKTALSAQSGYSTLSLNTTKVINRYWSLSAQDGLAATYIGTYTFNPGDLTGSPDVSILRSAIYTSGSSWEYPGTVTTNTSSSVTAPSTSTFGDVAFAAPYTVTVTADAKSKNLGDSDPSLTYTSTPTLAAGYSFSGSLTRDAGEDAGPYAINQGSLTITPNANNYILTYVGANLTILSLANPVSDFVVTHKSNDIVRLSWTSPLGTPDNVIIFARPTSVTHTPSGAGIDYNNANSNIGSAGTYSTDNYLVYSGLGNSVEVTGLSDASEYNFVAYSYFGSSYSTPTSISTTTGVAATTSLAASFANAQTSLTWTKPAFNATQSNYWDEILVIAKSGSAVDQTPTGDGSTYSANAAFGSGTDLGSGSYVVYKGAAETQTVTGLMNGSTYYFKTFVRHGSAWSAAQSANATPNSYAVGDFGSLGTGAWTTTNANWRTWNGTAFANTPTTGPSLADNVFILPGHTITLNTSTDVTNKTCKNLTVEGTLKSDLLVNAPIFIKIYGTTLEVRPSAFFGTTNTGNNADAIGLDINSTNLTITGGGTINLSRIRNSNTSGVALTVNNDMTINYHGGANAGNASGYYSYIASGTPTWPNVLTVNQGKTLTFTAWASMLPTSTAHVNASYNQTINLNGTITFVDGTVPGNTATNTFSGHTNGYMNMGTNVGSTYTLNIGATGTLNVSEFYPNGAQATNASGTGGIVAINIASGGKLNVSKIADFRNANQTITGQGEFAVLSGAKMRIGSADGITSASASGPIQTTTRTYARNVNYMYEGTVAQNAGDGLPSSVSTITVDNAAGVSLNSTISIDSSLSITTGTLTTGTNNLSLGSSATAVFNPASRLLISGGTTDFNNRPVTFKSDNTGSASLGQIMGTLSNATNVTVERYIRNNGFRSWRLLSVPTSGSQTINGAWQEGNTPMGNNTPGYGTVVSGTSTDLGFDAVSDYPGMLSFNGTNFVGIPRTTIPISTNKAYFLYVRGDRTEGVGSSTTANTSTTLRTTGTLYQGTQTSDEIPANSYALIGNPYPSAIDFGAINLTGGVNNTFYLWDSKINGGTSLGAYQTFSETNSFQCPLPNGSFTQGAVNKTIQSGQAFFVETSGTPGTVSITESSKIASTGTTGYKLPGELVKIDSRLYSINTADTTMADANVVVFDSAYSNAVDGADASKFSNAGENLAILRNVETLVIEGRNPVVLADTIFFKMWNMKPQAYQLEFVPQNLGAQNLTARLEDSYLNTSTPVDLSSNTLVNFTVNATAASYASNRFRIVFAPSMVLPVSFQSISASRKASNVQVNWKLGIETNVNRYEVERSIDGSKFNAVGNVAAIGASAYGFTDMNAPSRNLFYRIRSIGTAGEVKYSSVVKVGAESSKPSFAVVPNPVEGSVVNIQFGNQAKGVYQLRLVNAVGQQVTTTSVSHPGGFGTHTISLPSATARGTYQLEIIAPDRSSSFEKIFVNNTL